MTFFPCHLGTSIPNISRQSSCLGICPAPLETEAQMTCLEMTGGSKVALRMPAGREAKLDFCVVYQSWRLPRVTVVLLVPLMATVCLPYIFHINFLPLMTHA